MTREAVQRKALRRERREPVVGSYPFHRVDGRQIDRRNQLVFIYFSWQPLQAVRNSPISLLNSSRRLVVLAFWASLEAVAARR